MLTRHTKLDAWTDCPQITDDGMYIHSVDPVNDKLESEVAAPAGIIS